MIINVVTITSQIILFTTINNNIVPSPEAGIM